MDVQGQVVDGGSAICNDQDFGEKSLCGLRDVVVWKVGLTKYVCIYM